MMKRIELRYFLIETALSALFVFISAGAQVAVNLCNSGCQALTTMQAMGNMHRRLSSMGMPCPPPTAVIQTCLATGFVAAVVSGLSFSPSVEDKSIVKAVASGGHFNPAVTLSLGFRRYVPPHRLVSFVAGQLLGSICGSALLLGVVGRPCMMGVFENSSIALPLLSRTILIAVLTVVITLVHLWAHQKAMFMGTPILVGFAYIAASLVGLAMLGNDVPNMLRSFGLASMGALGWGSVGTAALGAFCGAGAAALLDALIFGQRIWLQDEDYDDEQSADSDGGMNM